MEDQTQHVLIANPENRRVEFFQNALVRMGLPRATVIAYSDLIDSPTEILRGIDRNAVVRIDSPGENAAVERKLIALGANDAQQDRCHRIDATAAMKLDEDRGRIRYLRQWHLGLTTLMNRIKAELPSDCAYYNHPDDILLMFDKPGCHSMLKSHEVPTTDSAGPFDCFRDISQWMRQNEWKRVFIKPAHSSSASGVVALTHFGDQLRAVTSVETEVVDGEARYYNNLKLSTYTSALEIEALVDFLCRDRVQVEHWLPKVNQNGRNLDLRILVVNGEARHTVVRTSKSPITNLHLGNRRGDLEAFVECIGSTKWAEIRETACRAARIVPRSLYVGVDVLVKPRTFEPVVLELNAFGDLLPRVLFNGHDAWESEIQSLPAHLAAPRA